MSDQKMSQNKEKKVAIVAEVKEKVDKAKAMVFTDFTGLTHKQLEGFKKEIKKADAEFAATKNTLLKRALGTQAEGNEDKFQQPTGTLFMYGDIVEPLKLLTKMIKELEKPTIKFGLLEGKAMSEADVKKLATLPNREILIAQMLGMMNAPIQGLHRALSWNLQKFVMTLDAVAKKKATQGSMIKDEGSSEATPVVKTEGSKETKETQETKEEEVSEESTEEQKIEETKES